MDSRWCRIRSQVRRRGQARLGLEMSISRLPPFPSFFYSDLPRCSVRPSVRHCGNGGADFSSFEVRLRLQRRLPRSAPRPSVC